jgi:hypothetical protein
LPALLGHKLPILYCRYCMMLCRTFERKSLKKVRFLKTANTTLGHGRAFFVQFAANEFFGLFHSRELASPLSDVC